MPVASSSLPRSTVLADELRRIPRRVLLVLLVLRSCPDGCTYRFLAGRLGISADSAIRSSVRSARELELVRTIQSGRGRSALVVVRLTPRARQLLQLIARRRI